MNKNNEGNLEFLLSIINTNPGNQNYHVHLPLKTMEAVYDQFEESEWDQLLDHINKFYIACYKSDNLSDKEMEELKDIVPYVQYFKEMWCILLKSYHSKIKIQDKQIQIKRLLDIIACSGDNNMEELKNYIECTLEKMRMLDVKGFNDEKKYDLTDVKNYDSAISYYLYPNEILTKFLLLNASVSS